MAESDGADDRRVSITVATEREVDRWFGRMVLGCKPDEVRLDRFEAGVLPGLLDHDLRQPVATIEALATAGSGKTRRLDGVAKLGETFRADEALDEIQQQLRAGISPWAWVHELEEVEPPSDTYAFDGLYRAVDWEPIEISFVTAPANMDAQVRLSAGADGAPDNRDAIQGDALAWRNLQVKLGHAPAAAPAGGAAMAPRRQPEDPPEGGTATVTTDPPEGTTQLDPDSRVAILQLGIQHGRPTAAQEHLAAGGSLEDFQAGLLGDRYPAEPFNPPADVHATRNDQAEHFSLGALVKSAASPGDKRLLEAAKPHLEMSLDASREVDQERPTMGGDFWVHDAWFAPYATPRDDIRPRRAGDDRFAVNSTVAAGAIQTDVDLSAAYQWLVDQAPVLAYTRVLTDLVGNLNIPVATGAVDVNAVAEGTTQAPVDPNLGTVNLTPKELMGAVRITRRALVQTDGWVDSFLREQLGLILGETITQGVLTGSGASNEVRGIWNQTGVQTVASPPAIGALDFGTFSQMKFLVDQQKAMDTGSRLFVVSNDVEHVGRGVRKDPGSGIFVLADGMVHDLNPYLRTTLMTARTALHGDFATAYVGFWRGMEVQVDMTSAKPDIIVWIWQMYDVDVARGNLFSRVTFGA